MSMISEFENRCPECGVDVSVGPPCPRCGGRCCPCYHTEYIPDNVNALVQSIHSLNTHKENAMSEKQTNDHSDHRKVNCPTCEPEKETAAEQITGPKYPDLKVQLTGSDGNAFMIMGKVSKALRRHGVSREEIDQFQEESMSGDYDNLLSTAMRWVDVS